jgi:hypothetical protein
MRQEAGGGGGGAPPPVIKTHTYLTPACTCRTPRCPFRAPALHLLTHCRHTADLHRPQRLSRACPTPASCLTQVACAGLLIGTA